MPDFKAVGELQTAHDWDKSETEKKKEGKKVKGKWMLWEAFIFKRFFTRLGSVRNRRS